MAGAWFLRTPVNLGDDDGVGVDDGHLVVELLNLLTLACLDVLVAVNALVAAAVPAGVVVDGVTDVIAGDGVGLVIGIARLPAGAGHPDDAGEAVLADLVDHGLEEVVKGLLVVGVRGALDADRLIGQLNADLARVLADGVVLGEEVPDVDEVLLVVVADLNVAGADPRWSHDNIHAVLHGALHQGEVERLQIGRQSGWVEVLDVGLAGVLGRLSEGYGVGVAVVVGPGGVHVQAEYVALGLLESLEQFLKVVLTVGGAR